MRNIPKQEEQSQKKQRKPKIDDKALEIIEKNKK